MSVVGTVATVPQPLNGTEIRRGIVVRMTRDLPEQIAKGLEESIFHKLGKSCSFMHSSAYAKFKADWTLRWWRENGEICSHWWVDYRLDDFGRVTSGGIGTMQMVPPLDANCRQGTIDEVPPDRFRRETDQPVPKPVELKPQEEKSTFSRSVRGPGRPKKV